MTNLNVNVQSGSWFKHCLMVALAQSRQSPHLGETIVDLGDGDVGDKMDDAQLLQILAEPGMWLVRGGPAGVLGGPCGTLEQALRQAYDFSMKGHSPGPIVRMPNDSVVVPAAQIYRLWKTIGSLAE